ncbi:hypothetical protein HF989_05710 [Corynebacterium mucifaciens]|nr:hypothetical protein [Corynebacterium mucifaciens]NKY68871.1 hypothetical protein [Corynebacterium mucifaciens]
MLASLEENKLIHARNGWAFAATDALHDFFTSGDEEEIEAVAFDDAALASIRLLAIGDEERHPHRRVVISADVADATADPEMGESVVRLAGPVKLEDVAAIHVDIAEAEQATAKAIEVVDAADLGDEDAELTVGDAQDNYMAFYDPSELPVLVELL